MERRNGFLTGSFFTFYWVIISLQTDPCCLELERVLSPLKTLITISVVLWNHISEHTFSVVLLYLVEKMKPKLTYSNSLVLDSWLDINIWFNIEEQENQKIFTLLKLLFNYHIGCRITLCRSTNRFIDQSFQLYYGVQLTCTFLPAVRQLHKYEMMILLLINASQNEQYFLWCTETVNQNTIYWLVSCLTTYRSMTTRASSSTIFPYKMSDYSDRWRRHKFGFWFTWLCLWVQIKWLWCLHVHTDRAVWVCCCRYQWENEIWALKSSVKAYQMPRHYTAVLRSFFPYWKVVKAEIVCTFILMLVRETVPGRCAYMYLIGQCFMFPGDGRQRGTKAKVEPELAFFLPYLLTVAYGCLVWICLILWWDLASKAAHWPFT